MAIINGQGRVAIRVAPTVYPTQFISTWKTDNAGVTAANQISIPTNVGYSYNCTVDWGDGTTSTYNGYGPTMIHTYSTAGTYTVKISGTFPSIRFAGGVDRLKILEITNWGNIQWKFLHSSFQDCTNLKITAPPRTYQIDIMYYSIGTPFKIILLVVDIQSRKAWEYVISSTSGETYYIHTKN